MDRYESIAACASSVGIDMSTKHLEGLWPMECGDEERPQRGLLIVLEGADKMGKTTQVRRLKEALTKAGKGVSCFSFPNRATASGEILKNYLENNPACEALTEQAIHYLFAGNIWEMSVCITHLILSGRTVICDRWGYSCVAYSAAKMGLKFDWCKNVCTGMLQPDLVVHLDAPEGDVAQREGYGEEKFESVAFQGRVRMFYHKLMGEALAGPRNWVVINALENMNEVELKIRAEVEIKFQQLKGKPASASLLKMWNSQPLGGEETTADRALALANGWGWHKLPRVPDYMPVSDVQLENDLSAMTPTREAAWADARAGCGARNPTTKAFVIALEGGLAAGKSESLRIWETEYLQMVSTGFPMPLVIFAPEDLSLIMAQDSEGVNMLSFAGSELHSKRRTLSLSVAAGMTLRDIEARERAAHQLELTHNNFDTFYIIQERSKTSCRVFRDEAWLGLSPPSNSATSYPKFNPVAESYWATHKGMTDRANNVNLHVILETDVETQFERLCDRARPGEEIHTVDTLKDINKHLDLIKEQYPDRCVTFDNNKSLEDLPDLMTLLSLSAGSCTKNPEPAFVIGIVGPYTNDRRNSPVHRFVRGIEETDEPGRGIFYTICEPQNVMYTNLVRHSRYAAYLHALRHCHKRQKPIWVRVLTRTPSADWAYGQPQEDIDLLIKIRSPDNTTWTGDAGDALEEWIASKTAPCVMERSIPTYDMVDKLWDAERFYGEIEEAVTRYGWFKTGYLPNYAGVRPWTDMKA